MYVRHWDKVAIFHHLLVVNLIDEELFKKDKKVMKKMEKREKVANKTTQITK